jgi:hypothetical protein
MSDFILAQSEELAFLLRLKREDEISAAQLARLDFLLDQRGRQIDAHINAIHYHDHQAA